MAIFGKDLRGSGSKENVGRKAMAEKVKKIQRKVPEDIYDLCLLLIDAEIQKYKLLNKC